MILIEVGLVVSWSVKGGQTVNLSCASIVLLTNIAKVSNICRLIIRAKSVNHCNGHSKQVMAR